MTSPDFLDIVPERVLNAVRRPSRAARFGTAFGDGLLSLLLNAAVVGWLIQLGWPLRSSGPRSEPISVEIVDHVPGEKSAAAGEASRAEAKPDTTAGSEDSADRPPATAPDTKNSTPERPATPSAEPSQQPTQSPAPQPAQASQPTAPPEEPAAPPPSDRPDPVATATSVPQPAGAAVPPPPEHPNDDARPQLVEAPKPPGAPAMAPETKPVAAPPQAAESEPAPTPPDAPPSRAEAEPDPDALAPAPAPPKPPAEPTADQKRQVQNTAKLAAMLPFGASISANPFQGGTTGQDSGTSTAYRGAVYGAFAKASDVVAAAQAQHLRGQAVVAFTLDDQGGLATLGIAVSSRNPEVDRAALDYIRRSAPFPPPPPGAQRSFSPAIGFGLDE